MSDGSRPDRLTEYLALERAWQAYRKSPDDGERDLYKLPDGPDPAECHHIWLPEHRHPNSILYCRRGCGTRKRAGYIRTPEEEVEQDRFMDRIGDVADILMVDEMPPDHVRRIAQADDPVAVAAQLGYYNHSATGEFIAAVLARYEEMCKPEPRS